LTPSNHEEQLFSSSEHEETPFTSSKHEGGPFTPLKHEEPITPSKPVVEPVTPLKHEGGLFTPLKHEEPITPSKPVENHQQHNGTHSEENGHSNQKEESRPVETPVKRDVVSPLKDEKQIVSDIESKIAERIRQKKEAESAVAP